MGSLYPDRMTPPQRTAQPRDDLIERLRSRLLKEERPLAPEPGRTPAGVLLLLLPKPEGYAVLLTKRTDLVEHHKGEISLVGGARDPEDATLLETALREAQEEMGVRPEDVEVLGALEPARPLTSPFVIQPYVGLLPYPYPFRPSPQEIAQVLEVPLASLQDPANLREEARLRHGKVVREHWFAYGEHLIYGATARILRRFLDLLGDGPEEGGTDGTSAG